ncbi:flagellar motor switch protein FliM [Sphingomonas crocodyli]|uniref:Flagellar motor switch protein FliM n=1 Tax=Sphingomonas crocodyli TaxID=1979270 RepID=A0A437MAM7_9SPHN|nr:FliM/FliN family flagellar motor switch protein [Sphingomonas crocodyli]RVT94658.1 flagellar motor switch protein FliM [Sphingomonas crocodyli]
MTRASNSLSGDEVAALMDELSDISIDPTPEAPVDRGAPSSFPLAGAKERPHADLSLVERMNEKLARRLRDVIEPIAQARTRVEADPLECRRFEEWQRNQPDYMALNMFRLRPMKGNMMIAIEPAFISNMVDTFYGGTGNGLTHKSDEFTPSEERLLTRIVGAITDVLTRTWAELYPIEFKPAGRETNPAFASMMRGDEAVVVQSFSLKPGMSRSTRIEILYPLAALQPIEAELTARVHEDPEEDDQEWRGKLESALQNVTLPVRSVLARPEITVAQLMALKPGDVIPIKLANSVPLLVGNRRFGEGTIGEQEGRVAMMIEDIGKGLLK